MFSQLFASWSYSCAASLSLALLAQVGVGTGGQAERRCERGAMCTVVFGWFCQRCLYRRAPPSHLLLRAPPPCPQAHTLACELLAAMAQEPLSMRPETTVELTQLVSLLEAPAFAPLRLQLLQPQQFPALQRAVHGLMMLLPQVGQGQH